MSSFSASSVLTCFIIYRSVQQPARMATTAMSVTPGTNQLALANGAASTAKGSERKSDSPNKTKFQRKARSNDSTAVHVGGSGSSPRLVDT